MLPVYERDADDTALGANAAATDAPTVGPCFGGKRFKVFMRTPLGPASLTINQYLVGSSTPVATAVFETSGAGKVALSDNPDPCPIVGELFGIALANGPTQQSPEVLVSIVEDTDS